MSGPTPASAGFGIELLSIPETLEGPGGADFAATVDVRNTVEAVALGSDDLAVPASQLLPNYHNEYDPMSLYAARVDGRIVARGVYSAPIEAGSKVAWVRAEVLPEFRGRGIGGALLDAMESQAAEQGRTVLQAQALHPAVDGGERIDSPTGYGSVPAGNEEVRFLLARGYRLGQIERISSLELMRDDGTSIDDRLAAMRAAAEGHAGADYRFVHWTAPTAEERLDGMARLLSRMSTDAPAGDLDYDEQVWDADRVRAWERTMADGGSTLLWGFVEHVPSGELVAYNELAVPADRSRPVHQGDTLVHGEHRGHRLGLLVKTANLQVLRAASPESRRVETFNAEENRPMLDVNERIGFAPIGSVGVWRRDAGEGPGEVAGA